MCPWLDSSGSRLAAEPCYLQWFSWHQSTTRLAGEFLAGGVPLNFIAKTSPVANSIQFSPARYPSTYLAGTLELETRDWRLETRLVRSGLKEASPACLAASPASPPHLLQHPTSVKLHGAITMCIRTLRLASLSLGIALSIRTILTKVHGNLSRTPHSLSEDVPAALSSISNQACPVQHNPT